MANDSIDIGLVGYSGMARYALSCFTSIEGVRLNGIAEPDEGRARTAQKDFPHAAIVADADALVARDDVDVVHVASPPMLRYAHCMLALEAGKHVICEHPLSMRLSQVEEMARTAHGFGLLLAPILLQRYNPMFNKIKALIESNLFGGLLRVSLENQASDAHLPPEHSFWDPESSGGIWVEPGAHFFDLFEGWMGPCRPLYAIELTRGGTRMVDQVHCALLYGRETLCTCYHGFHQPERLDRQEFRLVFERGEVQLHDWAPRRATVHAMATQQVMDALSDMFPGAWVSTLPHEEGERAGKGRNHVFMSDAMLRLKWGHDDEEAEEGYSAILKAYFMDQWNWIRNRNHQRMVEEQNAYQSLRTALELRTMARTPNAIPRAGLT